MSFARKEPRENYMADLAFPRPTKADKKSRRKEPEPAKRIAANIEHAGYLAFVHSLPCVVTGLLDGVWHHGRKEYVRVEANHLKTFGDAGGQALKSSDFNTVPMAHWIHADWTDGTGDFKEWTREARRDASILWLEATHRRWFALTDAQRAGWQERAIADREAMRDAAADRRKKIKRGTIAGPPLPRSRETT